MDSELGMGGAYLWRDSVEHRLGGLSRAAQASEKAQTELREDLKGINSRLDDWGHNLSSQIAQQLGGLRAELRVEHATASQPSRSSLDWKLVAFLSALFSGGLVSIGVVIGHETRPSEAAKAAVEVMTP
jgi:hypothetical protein